MLLHLDVNTSAALDLAVILINRDISCLMKVVNGNTNQTDIYKEWTYHSTKTLAELKLALAWWIF